MLVSLTEAQWERITEAVDTLDNLQTGLTVMTTIPDRIHVEALRGAMPAAVRELRETIAEAEDAG